MKLALQYIFFAIIATAANLLAQAVVTAVDPTPFKFWSALVAGTGTGLVVKYLLDKHYIFQARHITSATDIGKSFFRYALTGVLTTAIFWGLEVGFHHAFPAWPAAKYVGGAIGLAIGYVWKYQLDRRFTFATP
ncbi:GtrA family protein [Luteolibacter soli]|uniref:GtrA family protein n=1 Tax=Luteolibacter soli TaxID=3135280 RepID=A0ABU9AMX0_9BACT